MNEIAAFLLKTIVISLSGVMAPGAVTAATIAQGTRNRWAGVLISLGHGVVEIPLIFLLMFGLGLIFKVIAVKIAIGLAGGGFLLWMAYGMMKQIRQPQPDETGSFKSGSIVTGVILSATNPYFLFWWATVGLNLAIGAKELGIWALVLFAIVHWSCDLVWLGLLSLTAFYTNKGAGLFAEKAQKGILIFCAGALLIFGLLFIIDAVKLLLS